MKDIPLLTDIPQSEWVIRLEQHRQAIIDHMTVPQEWLEDRYTIEPSKTEAMERMRAKR